MHKKIQKKQSVDPVRNDEPLSWRNRKTDKQSDRQSDRQYDVQYDGPSDRQYDGQSDRQSDRQSDIQLDRQSDRKSDINKNNDGPKRYIPPSLRNNSNKVFTSTSTSRRSDDNDSDSYGRRQSDYGRYNRREFNR